MNIIKSVAPSVTEAAFNCPHCGAFTTQTWYDAHGTKRDSKNRTPFFPDEKVIKNIQNDRELPEKTKQDLINYFEKILSGLVAINHVKDGKYIYWDFGNLHLSLCYACNEVSVWIHKSLVYPPVRTGPAPNNDLPPAILQDYEEARSILTLSPRGAAALLRLAIQKLCGHLGEKGKNIDDDIASLVKKGLSPLVQKALDAVRVIGNEAVHPGTLDLRDDPEIADRLFKLVNVIAEQMITNPKHVEEAYLAIPEAKRKAIEKRDENKN